MTFTAAKESEETFAELVAKLALILFPELKKKKE